MNIKLVATGNTFAHLINCDLLGTIREHFTTAELPHSRNRDYEAPHPGGP